jgi:hypothetical protein
MAIAIDKANAGTFAADAGSTTIPVTTTQTIAPGAIIVGFGWNDKTITLSSVSGGGLTWTILAQRQWSGGGGSFDATALVMAQAPAGLASGTTITATLSGSGIGRVAAVSSFTGVKTSSPVDGTAVTAQSAGTLTTTWTSGSYAILAGSALVSVAWADIGDTHTATAGTEAVESFDPDDNYGLALVYRIESSAGSYNNAGTFGAATNWLHVTVGLLAASGAAAPRSGNSRPWGSDEALELG